MKEVVATVAGVLMLFGLLIAGALYNEDRRIRCAEANKHRPALDVMAICRGIK
jgi:hypothetical protein